MSSLNSHGVSCKEGSRTLKDDGINISFVIPVYNRRNLLGKTLHSLFDGIRCAGHTDVEVIVVDDYSGEDLSGYVDEFPLRYFRLEKNMGPSHARNFGISKARGGIVFFIDSDVLPGESLIGFVKESFDKHKEACAVQENYTKLPLEENFLTVYKNHLLHYSFLQANKNNSGVGIATFCSSIKKDALLRAGGFNEHYRIACVEDEELGIKMRSQRMRIIFDERAQVMHMKKYGPFTILEQDFTTSFYKAGSIITNRFFPCAE